MQSGIQAKVKKKTIYTNWDLNAIVLNHCIDFDRNMFSVIHSGI